MSPEIALFNAALGLSSPWQVVQVTFDTEAKELHLFVDFPARSRFGCPACDTLCPVYDSESDRIWRHLNFFEHKTFLHARFPRVDCQSCGSVKTVEGSWARPGSGFTLLFEAFALLLCQQMPVRAAAALMGEHDTRLWHLLERYVDPACQSRDMRGVRSVKVDETARRRGHDYVTLFAEGETGSVLFMTPGKDAETVKAFKEDLETHKGAAGQIVSFSQDMSPAFASGVRQFFPKATQVVDRFHVMELANAAVDAVRRREVREHPELKKTRYLWLKNPQDLTERQTQIVEGLCQVNLYGSAVQQPTLLTVRAYQSKLALQRLWDLPDRESAAVYLQEWTCQSQNVLRALTATITKQSERILNYFTTGRLTNGRMEGTNSKVQEVKARAHGFRNDQYFRRIIYLVLGKLDIPLPTLNSG